MSGPDHAPRIAGILETILYVTDIERAERFYGEILGLKQIGKEAGRHVFFRVGSGVLLLFRADVTRQAESVPPHGADGQVHVCLTTSPADYEPWKLRLRHHGIAIEQEIVWPRGLSFYFRDPDGNLLEVANADIWPR